MFGLPLAAAVVLVVIAAAVFEVAFGILCGFLLRERGRHYPRLR